MPQGSSRPKFPKPETLRAAALACGGLSLWLGIWLLTGSLCWFQSVLGVPCPGCGSLRAAQFLVQGRVGDAHASHPLILLSLALLLYFVFRQVFFGRAAVGGAEKLAMFLALALYAGVFAVRMFLLFPTGEPLVPLDTALWRLALGFLRGLWG